MIFFGEELLDAFVGSLADSPFNPSDQLKHKEDVFESVFRNWRFFYFIFLNRFGDVEDRVIYQYTLQEF